MRALWYVRSNLEQHPGGDTTQILGTKAALEREGVAVHLTTDPSASPAGFDLVHLFHLDRLWEHLQTCRVIRRHRVPAVLSTIYWPSDEFDRAGRLGVQGTLARLVGVEHYQTLRVAQRFALHALTDAAALRRLDRRLLRFEAAARHVLGVVSAILPNSVAEQIAVRQKFGVPVPSFVVPNAVDLERFEPAGEDAAAARTGVLCVGRIEPRKNQLTLIRALRETDIPLTIVGGAGRYSRGYYRACRRAAGPHTRFFPHQPPERLGALYRRTRVHACVSWYETPGLASLEAALCGCRLVVTPDGSTREYFGNDALYCDVLNAAGMRSAITRALDTEPAAALPERIRREFTWEQAARKTLEGYGFVLRRRTLPTS